ncbi:hypothetical protein Acid7E03_32280 [Acidisoma sp. 7E03]
MAAPSTVSHPRAASTAAECSPVTAMTGFMASLGIAPVLLCGCQTIEQLQQPAIAQGLATAEAPSGMGPNRSFSTSAKRRSLVLT